MYKENNQFKTPKDKNAKIWRYMTFEKYEAMLHSGSLYFCTGQKLRAEEPYEGSFLGWDLLSEVSTAEAVKLVGQIRLCGPPITINCWHQNEFESFAMWRLYGDTVAVQSTFERLTKAFAECPCDVMVGKVEYFLPDKEAFKSNGPTTIFVPYLHKHRGFDYEREVRAIIWEISPDMHREADGSVLAPVDLNTLIEAVYVSPKSPSSVKDKVEETTKAYSVDVPVFQSELAELPLY